mmetsp:Transcript_9715/g.17733  ORF Transcript_9715/g.17733 Transcript_9715/m.17733 type:complete len:214 (-) Transcript_9715:1676-2317(-)
MMHYISNKQNLNIFKKVNFSAYLKRKSFIHLKKKFNKFKLNFENYLTDKSLLFLFGTVENDIIDLIISNILYLDHAMKKKNVFLLINSPGGSVTSGLSLLDIMSINRIEVNTISIALAASMGSFLLASGANNKRYGLKNCRIMIHQPLGGASGDGTNIENQSNQILYYKLVLSGYLSKFTNKPINKILIDTDRDNFMSANESMKYGLIDKIIN